MPLKDGRKALKAFWYFDRCNTY